MPNWCQNKLTVEGPREIVDRFVKAVKADDHGEVEEGVQVNQPLTFEKIIPREVPEGIGRAGFGEWMSWVAIWGTKWDAQFGPPLVALGEAGSKPHDDLVGPVIDYRDDRAEATYEFDTAWSPPEPVIEAASEQYPELVFRLTYAEAGNGFAGRLLCEAGVSFAEDLEVEDVLAPEQMWF